MRLAMLRVDIQRLAKTGLRGRKILAYLKQQTPPLSPADFGESSWATVVPSPQRWDWQANKSLPLAKKRLFYWTVKFSVHGSAAAFARAASSSTRHR